MKKVLIGIFGIIVTLWLIFKIFEIYNTNNILYNQTSFEVYFNVEHQSIDKYFNLPKGTFSEDKHIVICKLPLDIKGFKPIYILTKTDMTKIDCTVEFKKVNLVKYESYELKNTNFELLVVNKNLNIHNLDMSIGKKFILAKKIINHSYSKGKINRLIITKSGLYDYCL
jgi:hypothetical protein